MKFRRANSPGIRFLSAIFFAAFASLVISTASYGGLGRFNFWSSKYCSNLLSEIVGSDLEARIKYLELYRANRDHTAAVNDQLMKEILLRSKTFESNLKSGSINRSYDFILIGGGINSAIVLATIKRSMPEARVLILEKRADALSVFGALGSSFSGNTLESDQPGTIYSDSIGDQTHWKTLMKGSRNLIPGAPLQVFDLAKGEIPEASDFAASLLSAYHYYKPDILFDAPVNLLDHNSYDVTQIELPRNLGKVTGLISEIGIGLGRPKVPVATAEGQQIVDEKNHALFLEDFLSGANRASLNHSMDEIKKEIHGKDVIFLGGMHGTAIGIEYVLGMAPAESYGGMPPSELVPNRVVWFGLKDPRGRKVTGSIFRHIIKAGGRYDRLAPLIDNHRIEVDSHNAVIVPGTYKPVAVALIDPKTHQILKDASGKPVTLEGDLIVYAIGYTRDPVNTMLAPYADAGVINLKDIKDDIHTVVWWLKVKNVSVGREVVAPSGKNINVFLAGPAAGGLGAPSDPGGVDSPVVNVNGSRSYQLGLKMVERFRSLSVPADHRLPN